MTTRSITRKNFKLRKLNGWESTVLIAHILICLAFWAIYGLDILPLSDLRYFVSIYYFMLPFFVLGVLFRSLRNFKFYLAWAFIGFGQLMAYLILRDEPEFFYGRLSAFSGLKTLFPALILFQLFRLYLLKKQDRELILSMGQRFSMWEDEDKRRMTWLEVVFSMLLMAAIIAINVI